MPTIKDLKAEAKKKGFKGYSKLKKAELYALLGKVDPKAKPKPGRKKRMRSWARRRHEKRTPLARKRDAKTTSGRSRSITAHDYEIWEKNPGRYDLKGIDTKGFGAPTGIEAKTVKDLRKEASRLKISGRSKLKKREDLIQAIKKGKKPQKRVAKPRKVKKVKPRPKKVKKPTKKIKIKKPPRKKKPKETKTWIIGKYHDLEQKDLQKFAKHLDIKATGTGRALYTRIRKHLKAQKMTQSQAAYLAGLKHVVKITARTPLGSNLFQELKLAHGKYVGGGGKPVKGQVSLQAYTGQSFDLTDLHTMPIGTLKIMAGNLGISKAGSKMDIAERIYETKKVKKTAKKAAKKPSKKITAPEQVRKPKIVKQKDIKGGKYIYAFDDPSLTSSVKKRKGLGSYEQRLYLKQQGFKFDPNKKLWKISTGKLTPNLRAELVKRGVNPQQGFTQVTAFGVEEFHPITYYKPEAKLEITKTRKGKIAYKFPLKTFESAIGQSIVDPTIKLRKTLEKMGGNYWEGGPHKRVYFNEDTIMQEIGLNVTFYNTGNISSATLKGERISNSEAKRIIAKMGKLYYNLPEGKFHWQNWRDDELAKKVIKKLRAKMKT